MSEERAASSRPLVIVYGVVDFEPLSRPFMQDISPKTDFPSWRVSINIIAYVIWPDADAIRNHPGLTPSYKSKSTNRGFPTGDKPYHRLKGSLP